MNSPPHDGHRRRPGSLTLESLAPFLASGDQLFSEQASRPGFLLWPGDPGPVHGGFAPPSRP